MISRRAIVALLGGAVVTPSRITVAAAREKIAELGGPVPEASGEGGMSVGSRRAYELYHRIEESHQWARWAQQGMSPSISAMRSWSHAYKAHWHVKEMEELRELRELMARDGELAERIAKALGLL